MGQRLCFGRRQFGALLLDYQLCFVARSDDGLRTNTRRLAELLRNGTAVCWQSFLGHDHLLRGLLRSLRIRQPPGDGD